MKSWLETRRKAVGWGLFALTLACVGLTLEDPGVTWDELGYFGSAQLQVEWVRTLLREGPTAALDRDTVFEFWDWDHYHNPHPPIYKEAMALTWWAGQDAIGHLAALRLAPAILFAALVLLAFRWGTAAWGGVAGLGAGFSILLMPRLFGHAHLGATETPLLAFWMAANAAGWWALERRRRGGWVPAGIAWGLAAGTKFTGILALAPLAVWGLWRDPRATLRGFPIAAAAGVAIFWILNPMLWVDPAGFLGTWLWESFHRQDYAPISTHYLGETHGFSVPWHYAFVMTAAVTPLGILLLAAGGTVSGIRYRDPLVALCAATVGVFWVATLLPRAPVHDGVRQFIVVLPFLGMLAGYGLQRASRAAGRVRGVAVAVVVFGSAAAQLVWVHPYHLSYYGEIVGGVAGARRLGFETTYWMDAYTGPVLDWMNRELPRGARVEVFGEPLSLEYQQAFGRVRKDLRFVDGPPADFALVQMRQGLLDARYAAMIEHVRPVFRQELQGVPLVAIFRLRTEMDPEEASRDE